MSTYHKFHYARFFPAAFLMLSMGVKAQPPLRTVKVDCASVLQKMKTEFAVDPGRLVLAMEDALTSSEVCACPIVRTAVDLAGKEPEIISGILIAAIRLLPASAAQITECVLLEAPEAAPVIRATLAKELGEKSPELLASGGGKEPVGAAPSAEGGKAPVGKEPVGKQPVPVPVVEAPAPTDEWDEYGYPGVGVNGIYFSSIGANSLAFDGKSDESEDHPPTKTTTSTTKKPPRRPISPPTEPTEPTTPVIPPPISKTSPE